MKMPATLILSVAGFFAPIFFSACSAPSFTLQNISPLDARYQAGDLFSSADQTRAERAPFAAKAYRLALTPTLGADCHWYPSDSAYVLKKAKLCGLTHAALKGFSRYLSEFDADKLATGVVIQHEKLVFFDFPDSCDFW